MTTKKLGDLRCDHTSNHSSSTVFWILEKILLPLLRVCLDLFLCWVMTHHRHNAWLQLTVVGIATATLIWSANCLIQEIFHDSPCHHASWNRHAKKSLGHTVEIMVTDIESAKEAIKGGANSLELCANRLEGGTTPSIGFIEEVVKLCRSLSVEVNVLIRPRPGDFVYSEAEFELIQRDILAAKVAGVDGE